MLSIEHNPNSLVITSLFLSSVVDVDGALNLDLTGLARLLARFEKLRKCKILRILAGMFSTFYNALLKAL